MKTYGIVVPVGFAAAAWSRALFALVFGFFCVRLTKIYFAMLTLAFAQIVWAICFKWNAVTGGEQGFPNVPYPGSRLDGRPCRASAACGRASTSIWCWSSWRCASQRCAASSTRRSAAS